MNCSQTTGQEEHIAVVVPADFIHFKLELFLDTNLVRSTVDEGNDVIFVADSDRMTVRGPADIYVFT